MRYVIQQYPTHREDETVSHAHPRVRTRSLPRNGSVPRRAVAPTHNTLTANTTQTNSPITSDPMANPTANPTANEPQAHTPQAHKPKKKRNTAQIAVVHTHARTHCKGGGTHAYMVST